MPIYYSRVPNNLVYLELESSKKGKLATKATAKWAPNCKKLEIKIIITFFSSDIYDGVDIRVGVYLVRFHS